VATRAIRRTGRDDDDGDGSGPGVVAMPSRASHPLTAWIDLSTSSIRIIRKARVSGDHGSTAETVRTGDHRGRVAPGRTSDLGAGLACLLVGAALARITTTTFVAARILAVGLTTDLLLRTRLLAGAVGAFAGPSVGSHVETRERGSIEGEWIKKGVATINGGGGSDRGERSRMDELRGRG
jgi:hypothetical protein